MKEQKYAWFQVQKQLECKVSNPKEYLSLVEHDRDPEPGTVTKHSSDPLGLAHLK